MIAKKAWTPLKNAIIAFVKNGDVSSLKVSSGVGYRYIRIESDGVLQEIRYYPNKDVTLYVKVNSDCYERKIVRETERTVLRKLYFRLEGFMP